MGKRSKDSDVREDKRTPHHEAGHYKKDTGTGHSLSDHNDSLGKDSKVRSGNSLAGRIIDQKAYPGDPIPRPLKRESKPKKDK